MILYCPNCGVKNQKDAKTCIFCDTILSRISKGGILTEGIIIHSKYEVINQIAQSKFSKVYLVRNIHNNIFMVLKEMFSPRYSKSRKEYLHRRFEDEGKLLGKLCHPNLPEVFDIFNFYGRYYIVMEYIDGYDLNFLISKSRISEKLAIIWGIQLCEILSYLHTRKPPVIYRDMKPSNIMIREKDGKIFLVDFGLARVFKSDRELTKITVGTEGYIPPEQYAGNPEPVSDIYSLGVTLHYLVTGSFPFVPFIFKPIRKINPDLSEELETVIEKCINLKPEERYKSARKLKRDLLMVKAMLSSKRHKKQSRQKPEKSKVTKILPIKSHKYTIPPEVAERIAVFESEIAQRMLRSVETLSKSKVLPYLIQIMHNKDVEVRRAVATALAGLKDVNSISYLIEFLRDSDPQVRQLATWGLGELKDKRSLYPLLELLMLGEPELRGCAALALGQLGLEESVEPLIDIFLNDKDLQVRKRAAKALGQIGSKNALKVLSEELEKEKNKLMIQTLRWAIKRIKENNNSRD